MFPETRVTPNELRDKFNRNEGGYPGRIDSLRRVQIYSRPAAPHSRQPRGTRSVMYKYFDGNLPVMWLHCMRLRDGSLGGSGKMDPKRLLVDGVYYYCS